jgi:hypothetical protein
LITDLLNGEVYNPTENFLWLKLLRYSRKMCLSAAEFLTDLMILLLYLYAVRCLDDNKCVGKDGLIEVLCWNLCGKGEGNLEKPRSG